MTIGSEWINERPELKNGTVNKLVNYHILIGQRHPPFVLPVIPRRRTVYDIVVGSYFAAWKAGKGELQIPQKGMKAGCFS